MREVPVTLGGKERKLRYDFNALCDLERTLGRPMLQVIGQLPGLPFADIRDFLWLGVQHESDSTATVRRVGEWLAAELRAGRALLDFYHVIDVALVQSGVFGDPDQLEKRDAEKRAESAHEGNAQASQPA